MADDLEPYFAGAKLYGDDFNQAEISKWLEDEKEASVDLRHAEHYAYPDHALNIRYGFRFLGNRRFPRALGLGSAYGDEFHPIVSQIDSITIVESSDRFARGHIKGVPATYAKPTPNGSLPFPDDAFDLVTCFGVLHHIPTVSKTVREIFRCLKPGGYFLTSEPIISMGDWRRPRPGATKRERGIPLRVFRQVLSTAGFQVLNEQRCCSSIVSKFSALIDRPVYSSMSMVILDEILCSFLPRQTKYHPTNLIEKLMVMKVFYVLRKPVEGGASPTR